MSKSVSITRTTRRALLGLIAVTGGLLAPGLAWAGYEINLPPPVTPIAQDILDLHDLIFFICVIIFIGVFGVMFYSVYAHRKSRGHKPASFHENTRLEVVWTVIPFLILVGMAIPSTAVLLKMYDLSGSAITVKITGYQWKWRYDYLDQGIGFYSVLSTPSDQLYKGAPKDPEYLREVDKPLVLPVGEKVRFLVTASDVIHSWWVPELGVKKDAIPGFVNETWALIEKPGVYRGQCAELCGTGHGYMPIVVQAVTQDEFKTWVSEQKMAMASAATQTEKTWTMDELMKHGKETFDKTCAACHQPNGQGIPGVFPPIAGGKSFSASADMLKHLTDRGFFKDRKIVVGSVGHHLDIVMNGIAGTAMQAFKDQLSDADIAAVITYERNAFGNKTGDMVQPSQVKAQRK